jgi:hypothetical protein
MSTIAKTNAGEFRPNLNGVRSSSWPVRLSSWLRRLKRHVLRLEVDDFDWATYEQIYDPQYDLEEIDYQILSGRIFTVADAKPLNPWHRALFECIINLPEVTSVHEVGTGGGKLIVNLGYLLGPHVTRGASDVGLGQLALFGRRWPEAYRAVAPFVHDITIEPLPGTARADVVFTATVLMHIKRSDAYHTALGNLVRSAEKYVVLIENWAGHDYVEDLWGVAHEQFGLTDVALYQYDSGAAMVLVASLRECSLPGCFKLLKHTTELRRYD